MQAVGKAKSVEELCALVGIDAEAYAGLVSQRGCSARQWMSRPIRGEPLPAEQSSGGEGRPQFYGPGAFSEPAEACSVEPKPKRPRDY